ncbi:MAG: hypothetical protein ACK4NF_03170 [Planctomycetota bacterium]
MYVIIFEEDVRLMPWEHDEYFMSFLDMSKYDARQMLRKSRGILQIALTQEQAQQVKEYFDSKNISCIIEDENNLPVIPKAKKANFFEIENTEISFYFARGYNKLSSLKFEEIGLFSLGFFPGPKFAASKIDTYINLIPDTTKIEDEQLRKELKEKIGGLAIKGEKGLDTSLARKGYITKSDLSNLKKEDIKIYLDIFSCDLQVRMRCISSDFNYEILKEQATLNSITNFLNVVNLLIDTVGSVYLTPKSIEFLETNDYFKCMFESEEEFDVYNIWYIYNLTKTSPSQDEPQPPQAPKES